MNPNEALKLLHLKLEQHGLSQHGWTGRLDNAEGRFGLCRPARKEITISRVLASLNSEDEVLDTILHEIAHALAALETGENCGHDERWKTICRRIGARPERCYDSTEVASPDAPFVLAHRETGEVFSQSQKRPGDDLSQVFIRGRKKETLGKLEVRANPSFASRPLQYFDQANTLNVQQRILDTLKPLAEELGVTIQPKSLGFGSAEARLELLLTVEPQDGLTADEREFNELAIMFGLDSSDYERPLHFQGRTYLLVGFKPRNRKYPIIVKTVQGARYKLPIAALDGLT